MICANIEVDVFFDKQDPEILFLSVVLTGVYNDAAEELPNDWNSSQEHLPWKWIGENENPKIQVYYLDESGATQSSKLANIAWIGAENKRDNTLVDHATAELEQTVHFYAYDMSKTEMPIKPELTFKKECFGKAANTVIIDDPSTQVITGRYSAKIASLATSMPPYNSALNMAWIAQIKKNAGVDKSLFEAIKNSKTLIAYPIFSKWPQQSSTVTLKDDATQVYEIDFGNDTEINETSGENFTGNAKRRIYAAVFENEQENVNVPIDIKTLTVRQLEIFQHPDDRTSNEKFASVLEMIYDLFDKGVEVPKEFYPTKLDYLAPHFDLISIVLSSKNIAEFSIDPEKFKKFVFACLFEQIGNGLSPSFRHTSCLFDEAVAAFNTENEVKFNETIQTLDFNAFQSLLTSFDREDWQALRKENRLATDALLHFKELLQSFNSFVGNMGSSISEGGNSSQSFSDETSRKLSSLEIEITKELNEVIGIDEVAWFLIIRQWESALGTSSNNETPFFKWCYQQPISRLIKGQSLRSRQAEIRLTRLKTEDWRLGNNNVKQISEVVKIYWNRLKELFKSKNKFSNDFPDDFFDAADRLDTINFSETVFVAPEPLRFIVDRIEAAHGGSNHGPNDKPNEGTGTETPKDAVRHVSNIFASTFGVDWQERLAGAILFGRKKGDGKWTSFNFAHADMENSKPSISKASLSSELKLMPQLLPCPIVEINNVRDAVLQLSNESPSLVASSEISFADPAYRFEFLGNILVDQTIGDVKLTFKPLSVEIGDLEPFVFSLELKLEQNDVEFEIQVTPYTVSGSQDNIVATVSESQDNIVAEGFLPQSNFSDDKWTLSTNSKSFEGEFQFYLRISNSVPDFASSKEHDAKNKEYGAKIVLRTKDKDSPENFQDIAIFKIAHIPKVRLVNKFPRNWKTLPLYYGNEYEFLAGYIANSGLLPHFCQAENHPPNYVDPTDERLQGLTLDNLGNSGLQPAVHHYLRRIPVSNIRFSFLDDNEKPDFFWSGKERVFPLALDMPEWSTNSSVEITKGGSLNNDVSTRADAQPEDEERSDKSLVLVHDSWFLTGDSRSITIRKPTTSFWDWFAWESRSKDVVEEVLEKELTARQKFEEDTTEHPIADPAVAGKFALEYCQVFPKRGEKSGSCLVNWGNDDTCPLIVSKNGTKSVAVKLLVSSGKNTQTQSLEIEIKEGEVFQFRLLPLVDKKWFEGKSLKFHDSIAKLSKGEWKEKSADRKETTYLGFAPTEFWVELAWSQAQWGESQREIYAEELWNSLHSECKADFIKADLKFLENNFVTLAKLGRIELWHQVWNWDGRNSGQGAGISEDDRAKKFQFPFTEEDRDPSKGDSSARTTKTLTWDAVGFGNRPDFYHEEQHSVVVARRADQSSESQVKGLIQNLFYEDRSHDQRGLYYRFAVRAHFRYEGLYEEGSLPPITGRFKLNGSDKPTKVSTIWKRLYRPSQITNQLPKPGIRFVLPLTSDFQSDGQTNTASVLVVLDDRWYSEAGLPEVLEAGIETVTVDENSGIKTVYFQAGFDPTLLSAGLSGWKTKTVSGFGPLDESYVNGPIGFTYDLVARTPKIVGTGFIIRLPDEMIDTDEESKKSGGPFFMAKIGLRRTIAEEKKLEGSIKNSEQGNDAKVSVASDWTDSVWVQFLPDTDALIPQEWKTRKPPVVEISQNNGVRQFSMSPPNYPTSDLLKFFEIWVVLTEVVTDVRGEQVEQYFATFCSQSILESSELTLVHCDGDSDGDGDSTKSKSKYYARVLLLRKRMQAEKTSKVEAFSNSTGKQNIWERIFGKQRDATIGGETREDAELACPIVSPRVEVQLNI